MSGAVERKSILHVDIAHLTFRPPSLPGSYNRLVGSQLRQKWPLQQRAISYRLAESQEQENVVLVGPGAPTFPQRFFSLLPARARRSQFGGIGGRETLAYSWHAIRQLRAMRPRIVVCYDNYKCGPLLRSALDWPCRLILSQHGLSYFPDAKQAAQTYGYGVFDALWLLSSASAEFDRARLHSYEVIATVLPNGVDTDTFSPAALSEKATLRMRWGLPVDARIILFLGRLVSKKGVHTVLHSWPEILRHTPDAFLWIVGSGDPGYAVSLKRQAEALGVASRVRFQGAVPPASVPDCYKAADVYVFPTLCAEGMALSLLEAMASGLPCVVSDHATARALYPPGCLSLVPAPNLEDAFVPALADALQPSTAARLGEAARRVAVAHYSETMMMSRLFEFYSRQLRALGERLPAAARSAASE